MDHFWWQEDLAAIEWHSELLQESRLAWRGAAWLLPKGVRGTWTQRLRTWRLCDGGDEETTNGEVVDYSWQADWQHANAVF